METSITWKNFKKEWIRKNINGVNLEGQHCVVQDDGKVLCYRRIRDKSWYPGDGFNSVKRYKLDLIFIFDEIPLTNDEYNRCYKEFNKADNTYKNWIYFTISPDKLLRGSLKMCQLPILKEFCREWFNDYHYDEYEFAIESGKNKDEPHLHVHALVKGIKGSLKREGHYKVLKEFWNDNMPIKIKTSGKYPSKKSVDILYQMINNKDLYIKKKLYFINELKGSHANFVDLNKFEMLNKKEKKDILEFDKEFGEYCFWEEATWDKGI